jgi:RimJ/RimL family protein N-acetyltransferase
LSGAADSREPGWWTRTDAGEVQTRPANSAARHVAERAGFVDEGLEPGNTDMQLLRLRAR